MAQIEQLAQDELITHRTRDLSNTDFADPAKLLSDMHFKIVKSCSSSNSLTDCWKTSGTQKERVNYKSISKIVNNPGAGDSIILKNGLLMRYKVINSATVVGQFLIDINGSDKPNISGRDYFGFGIDHKGQIVFQYCTASLEQLISDCKTKGDSTAYYCYAVLASNNWKMDY